MELKKIRYISRIILLLLALFVFIFPSCSSNSDNTGSYYFLDENQIEKLDDTLDWAMEEYEVPGVIAGIFTEEEGSWLRLKGVSDVENNARMDTSYQFRIGSVSKTFIVTTILVMADNGTLNLDDTIDNYFPDFPNGKNINIRQLCNNTSGIFDYLEDPYFNELHETAPLTKWTPQQLVEIGISHDPYFEPGMGFHYSNTNHVLLGLIVEQLTGNSVEEEIDKNICQPLSLGKTKLPTSPYFNGSYCRGYMGLDDNGIFIPAPDVDPSGPWTAGAMTSNYDDMRVWGKALATGTLLSEEMHNEQLTWCGFEVESNPYYHYCLGVCKMGDFIGHDGSIHGYNTSMYYLPAKKATIVIYTNNNQQLPASTLFFMITRIAFPEYVEW